MQTYVINPYGYPLTYLQLPSKVETIEETEVPPVPTHVSMTYESQTVCESSILGTSKWKTNFEIYCDPNGSIKTDLTAEDFNVIEEDCVVKITA